jgi:hypothetical protein
MSEGSFEAPAPQRSSSWPSFGPLFADDQAYLALLHLPSGHSPFSKLARAVEASTDLDGELAALLAERDWRCHLMAASAMLELGANEARLESLWRALDGGSWAAPQLVAIAFLLDREFEPRARKRILDGIWPKAAGALARLYRSLASPKVQVLARLADSADSPEARDGDLYVVEWLGKLARVADPIMRARWVRSPP